MFEIACPAARESVTATRPLADSLVEVERPNAHLIEIRDEPLLWRLYAQPALRRPVPLALAIALARMRGRLEWLLVSERRRSALAWASTLAGPHATPADVSHLAREHLMERAVQSELTWHPRAARRMPVRGLEHLERVQGEGRGVILATVHLGAMVSLPQALGARGYRLYLSGGSPPAMIRFGPHGRWQKTVRLFAEQAGCRWVHRGGSFETLEALLRRGEVCWLAWDTPGGVAAPARLLDRAINVASGTARLALGTDSPVIPAFAWREGGRQVGVLYPAIDPRDVADPHELNARVAAAVDDALTPRLAQAHDGLAFNRDWR